MQDLRVVGDAAWTPDRQRDGYGQNSVIALTVKAVFAYGQKALARATHTVVPAVALEIFERGNVN
jgi:hypothetical protein